VSSNISEQCLKRGKVSHRVWIAAKNDIAQAESQYTLKYFSSRNVYFVTETTNLGLKVLRYTFTVSFPRSISTDETIRAIAGDFSEHVEATDRLEFDLGWRWFAANLQRSGAPSGLRDVQGDEDEEQSRGNAQMYSVAIIVAHVLKRINLNLFARVTTT